MYDMDFKPPEQVSGIFEDCIRQYGYIDIGAATAYWCYTSIRNIQEAVNILKSKGYVIHTINLEIGLNGESIKLEIMTPLVAIKGRSLYELAKEVLSMHEAGQTISQIANQIDAPEDIVEYWLKRAVFYKCMDTLASIANLNL